MKKHHDHRVLKRWMACLLVFALVISVTHPEATRMIFAAEADRSETEALQETTEAGSETATEEMTEAGSEKASEEATEAGSEEATEEATEAASETASEAVTEEPTEAPAAGSEALTLSTYVPDSKCTVTIDAPAGSLPYPKDELTVAVRELKEGTPEYMAYLDGAAKALEQDETGSISFARFIDITR